MSLATMMNNKSLQIPNEQSEFKENEHQSQDAPKEPTPKTRKRKTTTLGRPRTKTEDEKIINIAVPLSVYEKMNLAKLQYNNNLTLYINTLIAQDLKKNLDKYKQKLLDI